MKVKYYLVDVKTGERQECFIDQDMKVIELRELLEKHYPSKVLRSEIYYGN